jgi:uncharacterized protein (DUF433 family)
LSNVKEGAMAEVRTIISAFTAEQAARLTGVSPRQLRYWRQSDFFVPALAHEDRMAHSRLYSFRDLVSLKVLNDLRNEGRVPLQELRRARERLAALGDDAWTATTLYVLNKSVVFEDPETGRKEGVVSRQGVLEIPLRIADGDMAARVRRLRERDEDSIGKIERRSGVVRNEPVVAGTRIPVRSIQAFAKAGYSVAQIREEYPSLTDEDVHAAIRFDAAA